MLNELLPVACGLDVHKRSVTACLLKNGASGQPVKQIRTFGTMTRELRQLAQWLQEEGCQHVAMESTGVYWKPVYYLLEPSCKEILLLNAQHIKHVPGRKTDMKDAEWIATVYRHGLVRGSFVLPKEMRELRELTRYRSTLVRERASECNRIQKLLEHANIKLACVATDVLGKSGQAMLRALIAGGTDPEALADLAKGRLRAKIPQLEAALEGQLSATTRWLLQQQLERVTHLEESLARLDAKVEELCRPFAPTLAILDQIPGVNRRIAQIVVAEIGLDMSRFPTAAQIASWAGMCPGNHETGGKNKSGKTRKGCSWLRAALVEAGWAAGHCKEGYLQAQYHRICRRRGKKRACVAVGHSILVIAYTLIRDNKNYQDLGSEYFQQRHETALKDALVRRLASLGYQVTLEKVASPAA
jgi:transposase